MKPITYLRQCTTRLLIIISIALPSISYAFDTEYWQQNDPNSTIQLDHSNWGAFLKQYVDNRHPSNINLVNYSLVTQKDKKRLSSYIAYLSGLNPRELSKVEQFAYWVNLYNAVTVDTILKNYPTKSIRKLGNSFFSIGPWNDEVVEINGRKLSLNNIEHDILRPIFKDKRIHYAVNCASMGCPNLRAEPFMSETLESQLTEAACEFINHPRGANVSGETLNLSSIYKWYAEDFGSRDELIDHLVTCAKPELKQSLLAWRALEDRDIDYDYDWSLNEVKPN